MSARDPRFEALLDFLRRSRGFDFTAYKRSSLMRRCLKRMQAVGAEDYEMYASYLEVHPDEFEYLFNTILINVTSFYRDPAAWDYLAAEVLRPMVERRGPDEALRIWSAGCSSGEETYTIAIFLAEALESAYGQAQGLDIFRRFVKIYATDLDEYALQMARHANYPGKALEPLPEALRAKYFEPAGDNHTFRNDLRRCVIFGRHDLVQDPPISRLDLLVCRNTLMYFNAEAQRRVLARFHFALNDGGYLFLGRAEMLLTHAHLYTPVELSHRVFAKVTRSDFRDRMVILSQAGDEAASHQLGQYVRLRELALDASFSAEIVVDRKGQLALANAQAQALFGIRAQDLGRPLRDLEFAYQPLHLPALVDRAQTERRPVTAQNVKRVLPDGEPQYLDVCVVPLQDRDGFAQGTAISLLDVSVQQQLRYELEDWRLRLEAANEELQGSNEELETTNEELHATIEELQKTNEELQSMTEEMETVNEELQSTNEELQAMNVALRQRTLEMERLTGFLESILSTVDVGVVVLDEDLRVLLWNKTATEQWGVRLDEARDHSLLSLDIGLPVQELEEPLRRFLHGTDGQAELTLDAVNRRGKRVQANVRFRNLYLDGSGHRRGVVLFVETVERESGDGQSG